MSIAQKAYAAFLAIVLFGGIAYSACGHAKHCDNGDNGVECNVDAFGLPSCVCAKASPR